VLVYFAAITLVLAVILSPLIFEDAFAESFTITFDKIMYSTGDSITISGDILDFGMPVIAMSIYDPDGKILSTDDLEILPDNTFSKKFVLDSPFYKKSGEYMVKVSYGEISEDYFFLIDDSDIEEPEIVIETFEDPEIILLYTDKKKYTNNDVIEITGLVSALDSPSVLIGIYDPSGMPGGFYFGTVDSNLEFSTSFLVKSGVNFVAEGTYSIKAHYGETEEVSFFDYYATPQDTTKDTTTKTQDTTTKTQDTTKDTTTKTQDDVTVVEEKEKESTKVPTTKTSVDVIPKSSSSTTLSEKIDNKNNNNNISITNDPKSKTNDPIIKTPSENITSEKTNDSKIIETKTIDEKNTNNKINNNKEINKQNNLSVEDIELGIMLNEINLNCDSSILTDTISYYDGMGPALYRLCKFDSSLSFFNESLVKNPNDVEVITNKGSTLGKLGYFSEAIAYYDQAIKLDPDFLPAKNNKANALANLQNYDAAILLYNEILEKSPDYLTAKKNLDTVLLLNMDTDNLVSTQTNSDAENFVFVESSKKTIQNNQKTQESADFIGEIGRVFSTLGSLFGFLN